MRIINLRNTGKKYPNLERTKFNKNTIHKHIIISKPQIELYKIVKQLYPDAILNHQIRTNVGVRYADVAIPSLKMDIEYNAPYWHQDYKKDWDRTQELKEIGWSVFVVEDENGLEVMKEWISEILHSQNTKL